MAAGESYQKSPSSHQIDDSDSLPLSFPSQPPDIKIWFSSYKYESPESSDSSHGLEDEKIDLFLKDEEVFDSKNPFISKGQLSQYEYSPESDSFTVEGNKTLLLEVEPWLESSSSREKTIVPNVWSPDLKNENFPIIKMESCNGMDQISYPKEILQCEESFGRHESCQIKSTQNSQQLRGTSTTEQSENSAVLEENGFISTKNRDGRMKNGESSKVQGLAVNGKKRNRIGMKEDANILEKDQPLLERRALADQTNVLFTKEAIAEEKSGKWKCPRKSKPYAGPPLKQLRLGKWVRRVV